MMQHLMGVLCNSKMLLVCFFPHISSVQFVHLSLTVGRELKFYLFHGHVSCIIKTKEYSMLSSKLFSPLIATKCMIFSRYDQ